jgi:hypothetical protein
MNPNKTEILVILDASDSMEPVADEAASGLNDFIVEQAKQPGECVVTLVQFNSADPYRVIFDRVLAKNAPKIGRDNYYCVSMTPMRQCICQGIDKLGEALLKTAESDRPGKVVVVIITDGYENASRPEYTAAEVNRRITHQEQVYSWQFVFLGKNICSAEEGAKIGVKVGTTADFNNMRAVCALTSTKLTAFRASGEKSALCYNDAERDALLK